VKGYSELQKQYMDEAKTTSDIKYGQLTSDERNYLRTIKDPGFLRYLTMQKQAGATNVRVDVDKGQNEYVKKFGTSLVEKDLTLRDAAKDAVNLANSADKISSILKSGKVITGAGADVRLQIAKLFNVAGSDNDEIIKNTELLSTNLANQTLAAIKTSNLGTGQGFTNNDLTFLKTATTGEKSWSASTLAELARLSRLAAEQTALIWNARKSKLPPESQELLNEDDIVIPPAPTQKKSAAAPAGGGGKSSGAPAAPSRGGKFQGFD
jgi:hypothetical protein